MPPRYAYWTILIDGKATAFRARDREELLPTFNQLARKNTDIAMRYFTRGKLWDNPEQAQWANRNRDVTGPQSRDRDWRPGGQHKDPRARFEKRGRSHKPEKRFTPRDRPDLPRETRDAQRDPGKSSRDPRDAHRDPHSATRDSRDATRDPRNAPTDSRDAPSDSHQRARSPQNRWQERPANRPFQRPDRDRPKWSGKPEGTSSGSKDQRERPKWEDK